MPNKIFKYTIYWYPTSNQNYNCLVMQPLGILPLYFPDIFENYLRFSFWIPFPLTLVFLPSFICKCIFSHISRGFSLLTWLAPPPTPPPYPRMFFLQLYCTPTMRYSHDRVHAGPADQQQPPALLCCRWWKQPQLFGFRNDLFVFVQCTYIMCKTVLMYSSQKISHIWSLLWNPKFQIDLSACSLRFDRKVLKIRF